MKAHEEIAKLKERLQEAEDTLSAIRSGSIDALVVKSNDQQQVFTLKSADYTYRILVESMNQGAVTISREGTVLYSNKQLSTLLGRPLEQIVGAPIEMAFAKADRLAVNQLLRVARSKKSATDLIATLDSNVARQVLLSATKLADPADGADVCIVITDITERKRAEDAKDEFISLASHQLRTPATAVKQYLGMILQGFVGEVPETQQAFLRTAYSSNERELAIINDILKTAQIDSGLYKFTKTELNLKQHIDEVISDLSTILNMKKQRVNVDVLPDVMVKADADDLKLAVSNLVENASKYSARNKNIHIAAVVKRDNLHVSIRDEGVGINEADHQKIFEKFTRVENKLSDTVNGNGLGLYWVKRIAEMHGGTIVVKPADGNGTVFTLKLPL